MESPNAAYSERLSATLSQSDATTSILSANTRVEPATACDYILGRRLADRDHVVAVSSREPVCTRFTGRSASQKVVAFFAKYVV